MAKNPKAMRKYSSPEERNMRKQQHANLSKKSTKTRKVRKINAAKKEIVLEKRKTLYDKLVSKAKEFAEKCAKSMSFEKKEKSNTITDKEKPVSKFIGRFDKKIKVNLLKAFYALIIPMEEPLHLHKEECYTKKGNKKKPIIVYK